MISVMNMLLIQIFSKTIVRKLSAKENDYYLAPYKTIQSRKPLRQWPLEIPIDGKPSDVHEAVSNFSQKLQEFELPKILFFATPGVAIEGKMLDWCK
jgi:haloalkane dehalogenase